LPELLFKGCCQRAAVRASVRVAAVRVAAVRGLLSEIFSQSTTVREMLSAGFCQSGCYPRPSVRVAAVRVKVSD
jgi:hypothetical protein